MSTESVRPMHPDRVSRRYAHEYARLRNELRQRMAASGAWQALPALLDELHTLRQQYIAARRSFDLLTEDSEKLAGRTPLQ